MTVRPYIKGGNPLCWCGKPRRPGGRLCADDHNQYKRIWRRQGPQRRGKAPQTGPSSKPPRRVRRVKSKPRIDILATLAPVMKQLDHFFTYAEAHKVNWDLACLLDRQVLSLVQPLGVGYRFIWQDHEPRHLLYNLHNPVNHIEIK